MKTLWINFLHFYQPANIEDWHIKEAADKSYSRVLRALEEHPNLKFTANFTGCLLERLDNLGYGWLIERFKKIIDSGRLEIVGSAAYHPLLPLLPEKEIIKQIKENETIIKKYFGEIKLKGFFSPEMAYSEKLGKIIKKSGYEWLILDEISNGGKFNKTDFEKIYLDKNSNLKIIFASRKFSSSFPPDTINKIIKKTSKPIITATDAELYGLRHEDPTGEFEKIVSNKNILTLTISEFMVGKTATKTKVVPSTWVSAEKEIKAKNYYSLWSDKKNILHNTIWKLANLSLKTVQKFQKDKNYSSARWHLVRGIASCTFWWASGHDHRKNFGPLAWSPDDIERGVNDLVRAIRSLDNKNSLKEKLQAEKINHQIRELIWNNHWKKYWKK